MRGACKAPTQCAPPPAATGRPQVRTVMNSARTRDRKVLPQDGFNYSTTRMINKYLEGKTQVRAGAVAAMRGLPCEPGHA